MSMECYARINIPEGEIEKTLEELKKAQETIYRCYRKLDTLGVLHITEKATSEN